jgi:hypothetical protein
MKTRDTIKSAKKANPKAKTRSMSKKHHAGKLNIEQQKIAAKTVMPAVKPATEKDYLNNKVLSPDAKERLYEKFNSLILQGVTSTSILSLSLGVDLSTISRWKTRFDNEMRRMGGEHNEVISHQVVLSKLLNIQATLWESASKVDDKKSPRDKAMILSTILQSIKLEADLHGLFRKDFNLILGSQSKLQYMPPDELEELDSLAKDLQEVFEKRLN